MDELLYCPTDHRILDARLLSHGDCAGHQLKAASTAPLYVRLLWKITHLFAK